MNSVIKLSLIFIFLSFQLKALASYEHKSFPIYEQQNIIEIEQMAEKEYFHNDEDNIDIFYELKNDYDKLKGFSHALSSLIEVRIGQNELIQGFEINLLKETLRAYLNITTKSVKLEQRFKDSRKKGSQRSSDKIFSEPDFYIKDLIELKIRQMRVQKTQETFSAYFSDRLLRSLIQTQSQWSSYGIGNIRSTMREFLASQQIKELEKMYDRFISKQTQLLQFENQNVRTKAESILHGQTYQHYLMQKNLEAYQNLDTILTRSTDTVTEFFDGITRLLSKGFGSVAGNIKWRSGRLKKSTKLKEQISQKLKPLDLIFEKKNFLLTDQTIPGHWGHVGVWLGSEQQWRELGLWNNDELSFFQNKIEKGYSIYEVRRWGMGFNTTEDFINLDEIAAIRVTELSKKKNIEKIIKALKVLETQMGKRYDFGFDAMAADRIICTELITLSYGPINWPNQPQLGRFTITPDHMAELVFYENSPIEFIFYGIGNKEGEYIGQSKRDFARALDYYQSKKNGQFHKNKKICHNNFRPNSSSRPNRLRQSCRQTFTPMVYESLED